MYLGRKNTSIITADLNPNAITNMDIDEDDASLTYCDPLLKDAIEEIAYEIASDTGILEINAEHTETKLFVYFTPTGSIDFATLYVKVEPYRYSEEEISSILNHSTGNEREVWEIIFSLTNDYYNSDPHSCLLLELEDCLSVELTPEEKLILHNLIAQQAAA